MTDFNEYGFTKTDETIGELDHDEHYFELDTEENIESFMNDFNIDLEDFNTDDAADTDIFSGLDFQLSIYPDSSHVLEFGPIFYDGKDSYSTVDVVACNIDGLLEYLLSKI